MKGKGHRSRKIYCSRCRHFYITWEADFPNGCRALGFKGRRLPSEVVKEASGTDCQYYEPKEGGD